MAVVAPVMKGFMGRRLLKDDPSDGGFSASRQTSDQQVWYRVIQKPAPAYKDDVASPRVFHRQSGM